MIDSNAIDVIADDESTLFAALKSAVETGDLDLVWTHISVEELLKIADEDRRARLILAGIQLGRLVPTSNLITDVSRFDLASFSPDNDADGFEAYRRGRVGETHDALIVTTAEALGVPVATRDKGMIREASKRQLQVIDPADLPRVLTSGVQ